MCKWVRVCVRLSGDCCDELDGRDGECGDDTGSDVETRVLEPIVQLGERLHRMAQVELVYRADPDSRVEIRGEIGDMIAEFSQEVAGEIIWKAYCDEEIVGFKAEKDVEQDKFDEIGPLMHHGIGLDEVLAPVRRGSGLGVDNPGPELPEKS